MSRTTGHLTRRERGLPPRQMSDTIRCRHMLRYATGPPMRCPNEATDITYSTGEGRVLDAKCEQHRDKGTAMVEVDGRARTVSHAALVATVEGTLTPSVGWDSVSHIADAIIEALFATESMRRIILRHYDEREHLHEGEK